MSRYLSTISEAAQKLVQEPNNDLGGDWLSLVELAVNVFSYAQPRELIYDAAGNGTLYEWAVPSTWVQGFSSLKSVEYPAGQTGERERNFLDESYYEVVMTATDTYKFRLIEDTPATGETVRFTYTGAHSLTETITTIPNKLNEDSIIFLTAALACEALAAKYASNTDSVIGADSVDHKSQSDKYDMLAKRFLNMSGLQSVLESMRGETIANGQTDWDLNYSWGTSFLFHGKTSR